MKIFKTTAYLLLMISVVSCSKIEEEDLFDKSPTVRLDNFREKYTSILEDSDKGWVFQYFALNPKNQGGENYFLKFKDGYVTAKKDGNQEKSMYTILNRGGSLLSFNLNNKVLLDKAIKRAEDANLPDDVDFQFLILSVNEDTILLKGVKTGFISQLKRITSSDEAYLNELNKYKTREVSKLEVNSTDIPVTYNKRVIFYKKDGKEINVPFIHTDKGIRLYESMAIAGVECSEFIYDSSSESFVSPEGKVVIKLTKPRPVQLNSKAWKMPRKNWSTSVDLAYNQLLVDHSFSKLSWLPFFHKAGSESLYLGNYKGSSGLTLSYKYDGKLLPASKYLDFKYVLGKEGQVDFFDVSGGDSYYKNYFGYIKNFSDVLVSKGPYQIELDQSLDPTIVKFTSISDSDFWFTLKK